MLYVLLTNLSRRRCDCGCCRCHCRRRRRHFSTSLQTRRTGTIQSDSEGKALRIVKAQINPLMISETLFANRLLII